MSYSVQCGTQQKDYPPSSFLMSKLVQVVIAASGSFLISGCGVVVRQNGMQHNNKLQQSEKRGGLNCIRYTYVADGTPLRQSIVSCSTFCIFPQPVHTLHILMADKRRLGGGLENFNLTLKGVTDSHVVSRQQKPLPRIHSSHRSAWIYMAAF